MKVGIVGCGAIGSGVASFLDKKTKGKADLCYMNDKDKSRALILRNGLKAKPKITDIDSLIKMSDLIIEAASGGCAKIILKKLLKLPACHKTFIILSVGALINNIRIIKKLTDKGITIHIPSGAICGVDGIGALALGRINKIILTTIKPPASLAGIEYLKRKKINLKRVKKEKVLFEGGVKEAIKYFPKNINVAAILMFASSCKNIIVRIKADPNIRRNTHRITIEAEDGRLELKVENVPSKANPKTSSLAVLSVQHLIKKSISNFKVGS